MANVEKILRQDVTLARRTRNSEDEPATDRFGRPLFDEVTTIKARKIFHDGTIRTATGEEIDDRSEVITGRADAVRAGDHIDGEEVQRVIARRAKNGSIIGYWSYL